MKALVAMLTRKSSRSQDINESRYNGGKRYNKLKDANFAKLNAPSYLSL